MKKLRGILTKRALILGALEPILLRCGAVARFAVDSTLSSCPENPVKSLKLFLGLAAICAVTQAQVVINEIQYDDTGTDDREFVELYNAGTSPVDISGWILMSWDLNPNLPAGPPSDNNPDYAIPGVIGSMTTVLAPGAYYVLGSNLVPNVNQVIVNGAASTNLLENDNETTALVVNGVVMDSVTYEGNKISLGYPVIHIEGGPIWGNATNNDAALQSWARWFDGYDTNNNGHDFGLMPASPGTSNSLPNTVPMADAFDSAVPESIVAGYSWSFRAPRIIDPLTFGVPSANPLNSNPNAIPTSPQGGYAMIMWDSSGGGNQAAWVSTPKSDLTVDCYVFIRTTGVTGTDTEQWSIGVRGTDDSFHNYTLPGSQGVNNASSLTGINWVFMANSAGMTLSLIDEKNGGDTETVLTTIPIVAGVNDGWQRIRLQTSGNRIDAYFGGTTGSVLDGTRYQFTSATPTYGFVNLGYREGLATNSLCRPLTIDDLRIYETPLNANGMDTIGETVGANFVMNLVGGAAQAGAPYIMLVSATGGSPGLVLDPSQNNAVIPVVVDSITLLGLQDANISPLFQSFIGVLDGQGNGLASSAIPPVPGLAGLSLWFGYVTFVNATTLSGFSSNAVQVTFIP